MTRGLSRRGVPPAHTSPMTRRHEGGDAVKSFNLVSWHGRWWWDAGGERRSGNSNSSDGRQNSTPVVCAGGGSFGDAVPAGVSAGERPSLERGED